MQPSMRCDLQRGLHIAKSNYWASRTKALAIHVRLNGANSFSFDPQGDVSIPNRMTIIGSFSLIPSAVSEEHGVTTADDVFGESTKAVRRSYSADTQRLLRRDHTARFLPYSGGTSGLNFLAFLYRLLLAARFPIHA